MLTLQHCWGFDRFGPSLLMALRLSQWISSCQKRKVKTGDIREEEIIGCLYCQCVSLELCCRLYITLLKPMFHSTCHLWWQSRLRRLRSSPRKLLTLRILGPSACSQDNHHSRGCRAWLDPLYPGEGPPGECQGEGWHCRCAIHRILGPYQLLLYTGNGSRRIWTWWWIGHGLADVVPVVSSRNVECNMGQNGRTCCKIWHLLSCSLCCSWRTGLSRSWCN